MGIMKRYILLFAVAAICLLTLDQGVKLIIEQTVPQDESLTQVADTVHIHPYVNTENLDRLTEQAEASGRPLGLYVVGRVLYLIGCALAWMLWFGIVSVWLPYVLHGKRRARSWVAVSALVFAAVISNIICLLLRGGSLDWICIATHKEVPYGDHFHTVPRHFIFDLKDLFLWVGLAFGTFLMLLFAADIIRYVIFLDPMSPDERKQTLRASLLRSKSFFGRAKHGN